VVDKSGVFPGWHHHQGSRAHIHPADEQASDDRTSETSVSPAHNQSIKNVFGKMAVPLETVYIATSTVLKQNCDVNLTGPVPLQIFTYSQLMIILSIPFDAI
jgi:hypothetical protein